MVICFVQNFFLTTQELEYLFYLCAILRHQTPNEVKKKPHAILHFHCRHWALWPQAMIVTGHCEINQKKRYWKYQIKIYYVHFRPLYRLPSYYARRYCHLITLVTSVYRKTNVFLTTVGTAMPPGGKMGEWSPLICSSDKCIQYSRTASVTGELQSQVRVT